MNNKQIEKTIKENLEKLANETRKYVYNLVVDCSEFEKERAFTPEDGYIHELTKYGKNQQLKAQCEQASADIEDDGLVVPFANDLHTICGECDYALILIKNECLTIIERII